jgi:hypothetical protein
MNSLEIVIQYHENSLETCKQLFKDKRYAECSAILNLLDNNVKEFNNWFSGITFIHYLNALERFVNISQRELRS